MLLNLNLFSYLIRLNHSIDPNILNEANGSHLINDSYNANPASLKAAIGILSHASPKKYKRRILLLGDMLELNNPVESHRDINELILNNFFSQIPEIEKNFGPPAGIGEFHLYEFGDDRHDTNKKIRKAMKKIQTF